MREELDSTQIAIFYHPITRFSDNAVAVFEALLRWRHPSKCLVAPADFIAHSEETGLIVTLGRFALERAANDLSHWQRYFPLSPPLFVSVNLSRRQLRDPGFEELLSETMHKNALAQGTLALEVTESAVAGDTISPPRWCGCVVWARAGDGDFGTGASSPATSRSAFRHRQDRQKLLRRQADGAIGEDALTALHSIIALAHDLKRPWWPKARKAPKTPPGWRRWAANSARILFSPPLTPSDTLTHCPAS